MEHKLELGMTHGYPATEAILRARHKDNAGTDGWRISSCLVGTGEWNMQKLQLYFNQEDLTAILKIKTSRRNETDFIAWHPEKNGIFSVRSAYRLAFAKSMQSQDLGATSMRPDGERADR